MSSADLSFLGVLQQGATLEAGYPRRIDELDYETVT
jgi:hypothetical protein